MNNPALAIFDLALHTLVTCDASDYGIGAVVMQIDAKGSEVLEKYAIVEKETPAYIWAVERWQTFW